MVQELCEAEKEIGIEGEISIYCDLPRGHHGDHHGVIEEEWEPEKLGPVYYTPEQLRARERWMEIWGPLLERALKPTPWVRYLNTSAPIFEAAGRERSHVLFTKIGTPAEAGESSTSSASPATPTETR